LSSRTNSGKASVTNPVRHSLTYQIGGGNRMSDPEASPVEFHVLIGLDPRARTDALLARYRAALGVGQQERRFANALWLAPTREAVRAVTDRLAELGEVVFAPRVMTFDGFAEWILETLAGHITPVSPALRRALLREIVDRLVREGKLRLFRSIAATTGFLDLVEAFIADLKRDEVWPEVYLQKLGQARLVGPRDHELAEIYTAYQAALQRGSLFDNEGRFWSARQALALRGMDFLGQLDLVVVDGFTDFTATQHAQLADFASVAGEMWVSLPLPPEAANERGENAAWTTNGLRGDLFAIPNETLNRLRGSATVYIDVARTVHPVGAIDHVVRNLFGDVRATPLSSDGAGLEFHAVAGAAAEMKGCVTGVKRWLLAGVPPSEIVVVCRAADSGARLMEQFADAGVPVAGGTRRALSRSPRIKLLLGLLQLEAEDWRFERLSGVLNSSLLRPNWPGWDADESPRLATRFLRDEQLPVGGRAIVRGAERLLALGVKRDAPDADVPPESTESSNSTRERFERYRSGAMTLLNLDRSLHVIRGERTFPDWLELLPPLAREFGLEPATEDRESARDDAASWDLFERTLFALSRGARRWLDAERLLSLGEFLARLVDWLDREPSAVESSVAGAVRVLSPNQARHVDARRVWIVGLSETSFPGTGGEDCLFSDRDRQTFHGLGLSLRPREHRIREEMLLFWSLLPRARERLVLGYPLTNADGEPLSPSPFLERVRSLFAKTARSDHFDGRLDPLPDPESLISSADIRVHAARLALEGDGSLFARWASSPQRFRTAAQIAGGLDLLASRFHERGFGPFEGRVQSEPALEWIARRFDAEHEFNATELEGYATCPFRFAMSRIAGVRPPPDPVPGQDVAARGSLVHEVLAEVHRQLLGGKTLADVLGGDGPDRDERLVDRFRELVEERLGRRERPGELEAALLRIEGRLLRDWGEAYQTQWSRYGEGTREGFDVPPVPALFEAAFGVTGTGDGSTGGDARTAALVVGGGAEAVRIGGRIDRLDVGRRDGRTVYVVIDYKTGGDRRFKEADLRTGRQLQLVLYALAVQRLGLLGAGSLPLQFGYWNLREKGFAHGSGKVARGSVRLPSLDEAAWQSLVELLECVVPKLAQGMRRGEFPVINSDKNCTAHCELSKVCRVAEIRALPPGMARQWSRGVPADAMPPSNREGP
jgi:ATP-dependent helicase/nuclease subunit B